MIGAAAGAAATGAEAGVALGVTGVRKTSRENREAKWDSISREENEETTAQTDLVCQ